MIIIECDNTNIAVCKRCNAYRKYCKASNMGYNATYKDHKGCKNPEHMMKLSQTNDFEYIILEGICNRMRRKLLGRNIDIDNLINLIKQINKV